MTDQMKFDGFNIDWYKGRMKGKFDLEPSVGADVEYDDVLTFMVTARCDGASFVEASNGDIERVNTFAISDLSVLDEKTAQRFLQMLHAQITPDGQMPMFDEDGNPRVASNDGVV